MWIQRVDEIFMVGGVFTFAENYSFTPINGNAPIKSNTFIPLATLYSLYYTYIILNACIFMKNQNDLHPFVKKIGKGGNFHEF